MPYQAYAAAAGTVRQGFGRKLETPLIRSAMIGPSVGAELLFKAENFQSTGSFKIRGATARLMSLDAGQARRGIITASSGNHGIACAQAARDLGFPLTVVVPEDAAAVKKARITGLGAEIIVHGAETGISETFARARAARDGLTYVSPYNDADVIAGQGTLGLELIEQCGRIDNLFIAMGGGGLIGGVGAVMKAFSPQTRIFGCSAEATPALAVSLRQGRVVPVTHHPTLADGVSGDMEEGSITFPLAQAVIDEVVSSSEAEIEAAFIRLALEEKQIVEGAAALALAGFLKVAPRLKGQTSVIILCGANIAPEKILKLLAHARPGDPS